MELEFDKEIDAILRKARDGVAVTSSVGPHLDADAVTAFAENALPDEAKLLYIEHFADCDRCRKQLSFVVQMSSEAEAVPTSPVPAPEVEASIPWFQKLFKAPNLALTFGAMVLVFSGVLGYLVIQKQNADSSTLSQAKEPDRSRSVPNFSGENNTANAAPANVMMPAANAAPPTNAAADAKNLMQDRASGPYDRSDADQTKSDAVRGGGFQIDGASGSENTFILDGQEVSGAKPAAKAAAPPPVTTDSTSSGIAMERDEKMPVDDGKLKEESKDLELAKKRQAEDRGSRDVPRAASKVGPARGVVGPAQNQANQMNSQMPVTRVVGGKTFNNRDGSWYDSAYRGQATENYRRGTDGYKKLDSGLRNIADTLGGTAVIVWKAKAYRIQ